MGGQRNSKYLRLIIGGALLLATLYVFYSYRQASISIELKSHELKLADDEYQTLDKRFDMLTNELKGN